MYLLELPEERLYTLLSGEECYNTHGIVLLLDQSSVLDCTKYGIICYSASGKLFAENNLHDLGGNFALWITKICKNNNAVKSCHVEM